MFASAKAAFFASLTSSFSIALAAPQYKAQPAGIGTPATFICSNGSAGFVTSNLTLDGAVAKATVWLKDGSTVELEGAHTVEIAGPGTRITGMAIHAVTLDGFNGASFDFEVVENQNQELSGNGTFAFSAAVTPATWLGSCWSPE